MESKPFKIFKRLDFCAQKQKVIPAQRKYDGGMGVRDSRKQSVWEMGSKTDIVQVRREKKKEFKTAPNCERDCGNS